MHMPYCNTARYSPYTTLHAKALKKNASQLIERQWVSCTHPSYVGVRAQVCLTIELLTRAEAELRPAGKARDAPNEHPHLDEPLRPSILDALGFNLNFFNRRVQYNLFRQWILFRHSLCLVPRYLTKTLTQLLLRIMHHRRLLAALHSQHQQL